MTLKGFFWKLGWVQKDTFCLSFLLWKPWMKPYLQGNGSVGQEAGLQGVHQVHIITRHLDPDVLPAQLFIGPLRRAVTAVNNQIRAVSVAHTGFPQSRNYAQKNQRSHGGLSLFCFVFQTRSFQVTSFTFHVVLGHDQVQHVIEPTPPTSCWSPAALSNICEPEQLRVHVKVWGKSFALFKFAGKMFSVLPTERRSTLPLLRADRTRGCGSKIVIIHRKPVSFRSDGAQRCPPLSSCTPRVLGLVVLGPESPSPPGPDRIRRGLNFSHPELRHESKWLVWKRLLWENHRRA